MKKTLIITLEHPPTIGGIATYVHQFAQAMDPEHVVVYAPDVEGAKEWDAAQPYTILRHKPLFPGVIWPRWLRLLFQVRKIVKTHNIELIFLHHILPVGYVARVMKRWYKIPFLIFSHGTDVLFSSRSAWKRMHVRGITSCAEQILFNSESLRQRFLREYPEFEDKSMVLYPCPDEELLSPPSDVVIEEMRNQLALRGKKIILSVGRLTDGKGFTHFIRMLPEIARKYPHVIWLLIGEGEKREYVLEQIRARNLQSVVRFIGPVPHSEIGRYYHLADLFVLLTHPDEGMEEGLGLVFLEAAASGLAVVAGKSGGVEEAVIHAETGIMVDVYRDGDDAIEDTIVDLLEQDAYRQELGQTAQQRIRSEFRWPSQIARLERWMK